VGFGKVDGSFTGQECFHKTVFNFCILSTLRSNCLVAVEGKAFCTQNEADLLRRKETAGREKSPRSKNEWNYISTPPIRLHGVVLS